LSGLPPLISDWIRLKLKWGYIQNIVMRPFTLKAGEEKRLPVQDYIFAYPEGIILEFSAAFDHPKCGIRLECYPELDTADFFTVASLALGGYKPEPLIYVIIPPTSAFYAIRIPSPWIFMEWTKLSVFNPDSVDHTVIGHGYHMAVLKEPRPNGSIVPLETIERVKLMYDMFPELQGKLKKELEDYVEGWASKEVIRKMEVKEVE